MFEKLLEAIISLTNALNAHAAALAANPTEPAKPRKTAAKDTPAAGQPAPGTATNAGQDATPQTVKTAAMGSQPSVDAALAQETGKALARVANEISRDVAVAILAKYGAQSFGGVKPSDFAAMKADLEAALKPAVPQGAAGLL